MWPGWETELPRGSMTRSPPGSEHPLRCSSFCADRFPPWAWREAVHAGVGYYAAQGLPRAPVWPPGVPQYGHREADVDGGRCGMPAGLLGGMRVVEVPNATTEHAGRVLAELGAEVFLIEPPEGSPTRARRPHVATAD